MCVSVCHGGPGVQSLVSMWEGGDVGGRGEKQTCKVVYNLSLVEQLGKLFHSRVVSFVQSLIRNLTGHLK